MSKIRLTLETAPVMGKQISFVAPCRSVEAESLIINDVEYTLCDALGNNVAQIPDVWAENAIVAIIVDTETRRAFIQNPAGTGLTDELAQQINVDHARLDEFIRSFSSNDESTAVVEYTIPGDGYTATFVNNGSVGRFCVTFNHSNLPTFQYGTTTELYAGPLPSNLMPRHIVWSKSYMNTGIEIIYLSISAEPTSVNTIRISFSVGGAVDYGDLDINSIRDRSFHNTYIPAQSFDTEVEDIRVGYDGTTYATAGEAIRDQVGDLHATIGDMDTALDTIIAIQNSLIGGDSA